LTGRILIIDDEAGIRSSLRSLLEDEGLQVHEAPSGETGLALVDEHDPDLVLLDLLLNGIDGLEVLARLGERGYRYPVIMMSGQANLDNAMQATRLGAMTFLEKPLTPERVLAEVSAALELAQLRRENESLKEEIDQHRHMIGESAPMQRLRERIRKVAPTQATVLILGESGTGKELVARAVHEHSDRSGKAFVKVNCAAIPGELIESELFGHEKGSFTGASSLHRGRFEQADGGSIFLDEVADTSSEAQARLLRVLQEGEVQRIGSEKVLHVDVRVIAASNQKLDELIEDGRFREDLYYRLNVLPLQVPPLRARLEDIGDLSRDFVAQFTRQNNRYAIDLTPQAMGALMSCDWPGNVRELRNTVERLMILHEGQSISGDDVREVLPASSDRLVNDGEEAMGASLRELVEAYEARLLTRELEAANGVVSRVAEHLRTDRANLYRKLKRYGLR
jgi:two-component system nitrogen regulation response regulator NtrX